MTDSATVFQFEQDFAGTLRCIPMAVRFKLDRCGVKLALPQWLAFTDAERRELLMARCDEPAAVARFRQRLIGFIESLPGEHAQTLAVESNPPWSDAGAIPEALLRYASSVGVPAPTLQQWAALAPLQRFALLKLSRAKHDNVNFVPALREFGILN